MMRRRVQFALLATMTLLTAGAVMAARPSSPTPASQQADTPQQTVAKASSKPARSPKTARESLAIPADLQNHRLKIRLDRDLGARVLPNGQLFSMHGRDLSSLDALFDRLNITLSPALTISETDLARARRRAQFGAGGTFADLGATFWADTNTTDVADIDRVARRLERVNEIEFIRFSRNTQPRRPVNKKRPNRNSQGNDDVWIAGAIDGQRDVTPGESLMRAATLRRMSVRWKKPAPCSMTAKSRVLLGQTPTIGVARQNAAMLVVDRPPRGVVDSAASYVNVEDYQGYGPAWVAGSSFEADEAACETRAFAAQDDDVLAELSPPRRSLIPDMSLILRVVRCRAYGSCLHPWRRCLQVRSVVLVVARPTYSRRLPR